MTFDVEGQSKKILAFSSPDLLRQEETVTRVIVVIIGGVF